MYLCARSDEFSSFYDFSIGIWTSSDSVICFVYFSFH